MKSIFKRYCLTQTYLSRYVKTSNEDKYHRGVKSCIGKWIPEWSRPLVPDAIYYDIGQSGWSEQCSSRSESRTDITACPALGQKIPDRWHSRFEKQTREWPQAYHQHQERQGCGNTTASPEHFQSKRRLGGRHRETG